MTDESTHPPDEPRLARPYAVTGGRTEAAVDLPLEALIETIAAGPTSGLPGTIADLCDTPLSVAEIATAIGLPIGVTRVLIADLILAGILRRHDTLAADATLFERRALLERTLGGLRAL
ncbi:DUF742 domain-containing protein [Nocardia arthritidis]|uniref:DUF742 domain-containing protein n=1 Tax=Nocardia arthritidis TaxID=228602 RepID=UPI001EEA3E82|nr:DUF742 domain-containing protein [Nocardia arthritidis]